VKFTKKLLVKIVLLICFILLINSVIAYAATYDEYLDVDKKKVTVCKDEHGWRVTYSGGSANFGKNTTVADIKRIYKLHKLTGSSIRKGTCNK